MPPDDELDVDEVDVVPPDDELEVEDVEDELELVVLDDEPPEPSPQLTSATKLRLKIAIAAADVRGRASRLNIKGVVSLALLIVGLLTGCDPMLRVRVWRDCERA